MIVRDRYGAYAERQLAALGALELTDEKWLEAVIDFGARFSSPPVVPDYDTTVLAIIVFQTGESRVEALTQARER